jgi:hypothetical protein
LRQLKIMAMKQDQEDPDGAGSVRSRPAES